MLLILKPLIIGLAILLILVMLNFVLAVAKALKFGKFDWTKFLNFMKTGLLPYTLIWIFLAGVGIGIPLLINALGYDIGLGAIIPIDTIIAIVWAILITKATADIVKNFKELGIEIKEAKGLYQ